MKRSEAIIWIKNLNSPKPTANIKEKIAAINFILNDDLTGITKEDLRSCIKWLITERENFIDAEILKRREYISNKMWDITPTQICCNLEGMKNEIQKNTCNNTGVSIYRGLDKRP